MGIKIKLIVGLGNPDSRHQNTYHNAGALFIDFLKDDSRFALCDLLKSNVYMNESGKFVAKELGKTPLKPAELLIAHDDSDIELGKFKLSFGRGAAGHRGAENVISALGTKNFWRLRIGIRPEIKSAAARSGITTQARPRRPKAEAFVLKQIKSGDKKMLESTFKEASEAIIRLLRG